MNGERKEEIKRNVTTGAIGTVVGAGGSSYINPDISCNNSRKTCRIAGGHLSLRVSNATLKIYSDMKNRKYNDGASIYLGEGEEGTKLDGARYGQPAPAGTATGKATGRGWKRAAAGAGVGLLVGGVSSVVMGMNRPEAAVGKPEKTVGKPQDVAGKPEDMGGNSGEAPAARPEAPAHPEWVDDQVPVATSVDDSMSFGEAFAAARAETGPGGAFEWHGQVYGTYTADEWSGMTAAEKAEYGNHFNWNHIDHSSSHVAQYSAPASDDDIEVVSVDHGGAQNDPAASDIDVVSVGYSTPQNDPTHDIEVIGVVHDADTGANVAGMIVDGQEVALVDVNGDMEFDYMAADANGNGNIEQNELADIRSQHITVDDLGGFASPDAGGNMSASGDDIDYSAGPVYDL